MVCLGCLRCGKIRSLLLEMLAKWQINMVCYMYVHVSLFLGTLAFFISNIETFSFGIASVVQNFFLLAVSHFMTASFIKVRYVHL